jgi:hypothetical protein
MKSYTDFQRRAIGWYGQKHGYTLLLPTTYPTVMFSDQAGNTISRNIVFLEAVIRDISSSKHRSACARRVG